MSHPTPQRFSGRAGSNLPGRVRRSLDAHTESNQRFGDTLEIAPDGRLEVKSRRGGGLKATPEGLALEESEAGEMNRPQMNSIHDVDVFTITEATSNGSVTLLRDNINDAVIPSIQAQLTRLEGKQNELLAEMRRTGRIRS